MNEFFGDNVFCLYVVCEGLLCLFFILEWLLLLGIGVVKKFLLIEVWVEDFVEFFIEIILVGCRGYDDNFWLFIYN